MNIKITNIIILLIINIQMIHADNFSIKNGYVAELVTNEISDPTCIDIASDGRIFISEKSGKIKIFKDGIILPTPFLELNVDQYGERGLSGIILDKEFDKNGYIYVYYNVLGGNHNRLSRFTASGNTVIPGSEIILLDFEELNGIAHNSGAMRWALDTTLIVSIGDGLESTKAQEKDNLLGKIIRLRRDGSAPEDNPFYDILPGRGKYIYALGLRNPFTMDLHPKTGRIFANDVGGVDWEEINDIKAGFNYGWPEIEGPISDQIPPENYQDPTLSYEHKQGYCAVVGGAFYSPESSNFPDEWNDKYIFGDFCSGNIHRMDPETGEVEDTIVKGAHNITNLFVSEDGYIYYTIFGYGPSELYRIKYIGNGAPYITKQPKSDMAVIGEDIEISINASGSSVLNYQWYLNGTPVIGANQKIIEFKNVQLADSGSNIFCKVNNNIGFILSDTLTLQITSNQRPEIKISYPTVNSLFDYGDTLYFAGYSTDPEDGLLDSGKLEWTINFHHDAHTHPGLSPTVGVSNGSIYLSRIVETSTNVWYRVWLKATDSKGLTNMDYVDIHPNLTSLNLKTHPNGLPISLDGKPKETDYNFELVYGNERVLTAKELINRNDSLFRFIDWSNDSSNNNLTFFGGDFNEITANYEYIDAYFDGNGDGLEMKFYDNYNFSEPYKFSRTDPYIDYQLDFSSFMYGAKRDSFSVTWTGYLLAPVTGEYTFTFHHNDGIAVDFDGERVAEQSWTSYNSSFVVNLVAGKKYQIKVYYVELLWKSTVKMFWKHPYQDIQIVPQKFLFTSNIPSSKKYVDSENLTVFPNPFNSSVNIQTPEKGPVRISVYNLKGNLVSSFEHDNRNISNKNNVIVNLDGLSNGLYFYQIQTASGIHTGKMIKK